MKTSNSILLSTEFIFKFKILYFLSILALYDGKKVLALSNSSRWHSVNCLTTFLFAKLKSSRKLVPLFGKSARDPLGTKSNLNVHRKFILRPGFSKRRFSDVNEKLLMKDYYVITSLGIVTSYRTWAWVNWTSKILQKILILIWLI